MKLIILLGIKLYWLIIPKSKRRKCLFKISCAHFVYDTAKNEGFYKGLIAFKYRFLNCRGGFHLFESPVDGSKMMVLPNHQILTENEISERFIQ